MPFAVQCIGEICLLRGGIKLVHAKVFRKCDDKKGRHDLLRKAEIVQNGNGARVENRKKAKEQISQSIWRRHDDRDRLNLKGLGCLLHLDRKIKCSNQLRKKIRFLGGVPWFTQGTGG